MYSLIKLIHHQSEQKSGQYLQHIGRCQVEFAVVGDAQRDQIELAWLDGADLSVPLICVRDDVDVCLVQFIGIAEQLNSNAQVVEHLKIKPTGIIDL